MKQLFYLLFVMLPLIARAQKQLPSASGYPQNYFRNPLSIPIYLAGNFGECRPGHFHSGIDIKTLGKENEPVCAAADGYVSRIKMDKNGFGHALYITHANGYTTLYAHLNDFIPSIQKYMHREQYEKKRWDVDIVLAPATFPVKKGQQIAWSGNTGGSTAPHLHFEIRNSKTEHPLNPQLFGLPIVDNIAPVPVELAIYEEPIIYAKSPMILKLKKDEDNYVIGRGEGEKFHFDGDTVRVNTPVGVGINVDDFMQGSDNTLTFLTAGLYMDGILQSEVRLDDIGYDQSRYVNAYADYKTKKEKGKWIQCLFKLPGNRLDNIYTYLNSSNGTLNGIPGKKNEIKIIIADNNNNKTTILFYLAPLHNVPGSPPIIEDNYTKFAVNQENNFRNSELSFSLDDRQLYDDIYFVYKKTADPKMLSDRHSIGDVRTPVHHYFDLRIKPNNLLPARYFGKVVMRYSDGRDEDGRAATADDEWYKAKVRNLGTYWLYVDTIPPVIKSLQQDESNLSKAKQITFEVKDDMTSVKSFSGYLDGNWICFEAHADLIFYKFDEHCPPGKHELIFKATDENENTSTYKLSFTR